MSEAVSPLSSTPRRMSLRAKIVCVLLGAVLVPPVIALVYESTLGLWLAKRDYATATAAWREAGLPVKADWVALNSRAVPDADNLFKQPPFDGLSHGPLFSWDIDAESSRWFPMDLSVWMLGRGPGVDVAALIRSDSCPKPLKDGVSAAPTARGVVEALERLYPDLKNVGDALRRTSVGAFPPLQESRRMMAWSADGGAAKHNLGTVAVYAACRAQLGEGAPALALVQAVGKYREAVSDRPVFFNYSRVEAMMSRVVGDALMARVWSDDDLALVQEVLRRGSRGREFAARAIAYDLESHIDANLRDAEGVVDVGWERSERDSTPASDYREAARWRTEAARIIAVLRDPARQPMPDVIRAMDAELLASVRADQVCRVSSWIMIQWVSGEQEWRAMQLAVALERYRRKSGSYPARLELLVPGWLPAIPGNPWDGQLPTYAPRQTGYRLEWDKGRFDDGRIGQLVADECHPRPWEIGEYEVSLPKWVTLFDETYLRRNPAKCSAFRFEMTAPTH